MESINPNDILNLDLDTISLITLKNGNILFIDDSIPEKLNKKKNIQKSTKLNRTNGPKKKINLKITSPSTLFFKSAYNKAKKNICYKIIKNIDLIFEGIKNNLKGINNFYKTNEYNKDKEINIINEYNFKNSIKPFCLNPTPTEKNFQNKKITPNFLDINITENNNKNIYKNKYANINQNNAHTNNTYRRARLINISNISNNLLEKKADDNKSIGRKIFTRRRIGSSGSNKKTKNSVNAVCSLNICADNSEKIDLINQFNNIVDKLNSQREKDYSSINENNKNEQNNCIKYYKFYKHKNISRNLRIFNNNLIKNNDLRQEIHFKTCSNCPNKKKIVFNRLDSYNNDENSSIYNNIGSKDHKSFKEKINKYSSNLILPCNKI